MAYALECLIIDEGDSTIKVGHTFYGLTEQEVETYKKEHIASCEYFRSAVKEGRVIEELEEIDESELPDADGEFDEEEFEEA